MASALSYARCCTKKALKCIWARDHRLVYKIASLDCHANTFGIQERAETAIRSIASEASSLPTSGELIHLQIDLDDLASVKQAAASFTAQESKLDILWNNAGVGALAIPQGSKTVQGTEGFMGQNCVGPLYFSKLLLPQLQAAARASSPEQVRVVWSSSLLVEAQSPKGGVDFSALEDGLKDPIPNYAATKAGNWFLAAEWARRYGKGDEAMISVTQNPGNLQTNMFKGTPKLWMFFLNWILHPPKMGAYTELYAGLSPDITLQKNGCFILPWGRVHPAYPRKDIVEAISPEDKGGTGAAKRFWEWCEKKHESFEAK